MDKVLNFGLDSSLKDPEQYNENLPVETCFQSLLKLYQDYKLHQILTSKIFFALLLSINSFEKLQIMYKIISWLKTV